MQIDDPRLTTGRFLADVAARHRGRRAVHFAGRDIGYAELESDARDLARALVGVGVVKGARVAVHMSNRPEWITAAFAVGMLGGVLVPVNTFAGREEFDYILRHSDASLLLMQPGLLKHAYLADLLARYPDVAHGAPGAIRCPELPQLRRAACLGIDAPRGGVEPWSGLLGAGRDVSDALLDAAMAEVEPSDDAMIIYTSGTTANPKGVLHGHRAGVLQGWRFADMLRLDQEDRVYTTYPFFWTAGIAMSLLPTFAAGGCLLLQESFEAGAALDLIEAQRATALHAWPHQQKALAEHASAATRNLTALRKIDSASPVARLAGVESDVYGTGASYGMSETFTLASMSPVDAPVDVRRGTSGRPLQGTELRVIDPLTGEHLPAGSEGEITVRGATLMRGYYKLPPEKYLDADGFFHTQDGGFFDSDGHLHWTGRLGSMIKTGGANVSPLEIESALKKHPGVRIGVPVGIEHPTLGEVIVLCVVAAEGAAPDAEEIRAFLRGRLAAYKVPKRVFFLGADEIHYTGNQKVQVEPLREVARERLEAEGAEIDGHRYAPR
jgi:fatty-acyl-CoA synthase